MSNLVTKAVTSALLKDEEDAIINQPKNDVMNMIELGVQTKADGTVATPVDDAPVGDEIIFQLLENFYNPRRPKHLATKENYINQILSKASNLFGEYQNINQEDLTKRTIQDVLPETVDFAQALADKEGYSDKRMMTSWNKSGGLEFDDATDEISSIYEKLDLDDNEYDISCLSEDEDLYFCLSDHLTEEEIELIRGATDVGFA